LGEIRKGVKDKYLILLFFSRKGEMGKKELVG